MYVTGKIPCVRRVPYFKERVLFAAVGDDRHVRVHTSRGKEGSIRASRDIDHAVLTGLDHTAKLFFDLSGIQQADRHDRDLDGAAAVLEIFFEGFRQRICRFDLRRTENNELLRAEHLGTEDVLNGALVVEFNNRFHRPPLSFFSEGSSLPVFPVKAAGTPGRSSCPASYSDGAESSCCITDDTKAENSGISLSIRMTCPSFLMKQCVDSASQTISSPFFMV